MNPLARAMEDVYRELKPIPLSSLPKSTILEVFSKITDPRLDRKKDIIYLILL
jgi:hypothetical protein